MASREQRLITKEHIVTHTNGLTRSILRYLSDKTYIKLYYARIISDKTYIKLYYARILTVTLQASLHVFVSFATRTFKTEALHIVSDVQLVKELLFQN